MIVVSNFTLVECLDKYGIEGLKELLSHAKMRGTDTRNLCYSFTNTDLELFIMAFELVEPYRDTETAKDYVYMYGDGDVYYNRELELAINILENEGYYG